MLSINDLLNAAVGSGIIGVTPQMAEEVLSRYDQLEMFQSARQNIVVQLWDGKAFNGAPLEYIQKKIPAGGYAVQTLVNGVIEGFQPFAPSISVEDALKQINKTADNSLWDKIGSQIIAENLGVLASKVTNNAPNADVAEIKEEMKDLGAALSTILEALS